MRIDSKSVLFSIVAFSFAGILPNSSSQNISPDSLKDIENYNSYWHCQDFIEDAGLQNHSLYDISFAEDGTAWIAASNGLYHYDGYHWIQYTTTNGLPSDFVRSVCVTRDGILWVGTDRGAGTFDGKIYDSHGSEKGIAGTSVRRIYEDRIGRLWFCCDRWPNPTIIGGLSRFDGKEWRTFQEEDGFTEDHIVDCLESTDGDFYVISNHTILMESHGKWIAPLKELGLGHGEHYRSIVEKPRGTIIVFSDLGVYQGKDNAWSFTPFPPDNTIVNYPLCLSGDSNLYSFQLIRENVYSLVRWQENDWEPESSDYGHYGYDWIQAVRQAPDGAIWCVGDTILLRYVRHQKSWLDFKRLPPPVFLDGQNRIWLHGEDGLFRYSTKGWESLEPFHGQLALDNKRNVWGWNADELYRWEGDNRVRVDFQKTGIQYLDRMTSDRGDGIWIYGRDANQNLTVALFKGGLWNCFGLPDSSSQRVLDWQTSPSGALWFLVFTPSNDQYNLYEVQFHGDNEIHKEIPLPLLNGNPRLFSDREGGLWLFSSIPTYWLPPGEKNWRPIHQTIGRLVVHISESPFSLWFQCNGGAGGKWGFSRKIGDAWSHQEDRLFFGKTLENGQIVFGGSQYFYISSGIKGDTPIRVRLPRDGYITGFVIDSLGQYWIGMDEDLFVSSVDRIPPETEIRNPEWRRLESGELLTVTCYSVEFNQPIDTQKQYFYAWRIDGGSWSPFQWYENSTFSISTRELPLGDHILEIAARDEMMDIDPTPAALHFTIRPVSLQDRWWFWYAVVCLFVFISWLAAVSWFRKKKLVLYTNRLEEIVEERTISLRASEEKYRTLIETTDTGFTILDDKGNVLDANPEYLRLTGYPSLSDIRGRCFLDWTASYDLERNKLEFDRILRNGWIRNQEVDYCTPSGEIIPIEVNATLWRTKQGDRIVALCRDIRERKKAEEALRFDEQRLETLLQLNQMSFASLSEIAHFAMEEAVRLTQSKIGYIAFANPEETVLTMYAWSKQAMQECRVQNKPFEYEVAKTGLWGEAVRQRKPIITNDYAASNPWKKGTPEGHVHLVRHMNVPLVDGDKIVVVAGVGNKDRDYDESDVRQLTLLMAGMWRIVQRHQVEEALKAKTDELDRFFSMTLDLLCIADTNGIFHRLNPQWERVLGYTIDELIGQNFMNFVHPDDRESTLQALAELDSQKTVLHFVNRYRCRDGSYRWIEWNSFPVGSMIYAAAHDITDRIHAEEERRKMDQQIQHTQKLESLGVLAGGIAHDFNNLLMAILGHAELALNKLSPLSPARENLSAIETVSQRAADLCRQMLAYSGKGRFVIQEIDLKELIEEMNHILQVSISKKASLRFHFTPNLPRIEGDASQIRQVVMNLIINASEAIGENEGIISVSTGVVNYRGDNLHPYWMDSQLPDGEYVSLEISDTGCGMDSETVSKIFDPFFTTKFTGRGLGLAAVMGIVRGHKGAINVDSEPGQGTMFKILFPAVLSKETASSGTQVEDRSWRGQGTILLVDDEEIIINMAREMLEYLGFKTLTASNGRQALDVFQKHQNDISCVLLDLTMPHMDGEETFRELQKIRPDVQVIVSSGYSEQEVSQRFAGKNLAGVIQKPYKMASLAASLKELGLGRT